MKPAEIKSLLAATELFGCLNDEGLERLSHHAMERKFSKSYRIFHQGDPGDAVFVLVSGTVKVTVTSERGDEMVLVTLEPPATVGELALADGLERSATVETLRETSVLSIGRDPVLALIEENPALARGLLSSLGGLIRRLTDQAADFVFLDLHARVAKLLLQLADSRGEVTAEGTVLDLYLTQGEIAQMVGGSRQSVNQIIRSFEHRGFLEVHRKAVVLKSLPMLARRAGL